VTHPATASLARLEALVDDNLEALAAGAPIDHAAVSEAKGRALLELSRQRAPAAAVDQDLAEQVGRLRGKLAEEQRLLAIRLRAAELVGEIVAEALLETESDGTYGPCPPVPPTAGRTA
jgi:VIT1/CCC1 family predicted Fe2+/Mn2+ transporter